MGKRTTTIDAHVHQKDIINFTENHLYFFKLGEKLYFLTLGGLMSIPLSIYYQKLFSGFLLRYFSNSIVFFFSVVILTPLIEEFMKMILLMYRGSEYNKHLVNRALYLGLGFGLLELLSYVIFYNVSIKNRIPSLIFHPLSAIIIGYGMEKQQALRYFSVSLFFHASNNFIKFAYPDWILGWLIINIAAIVTAISLYQESRARWF